MHMGSFKLYIASDYIYGPSNNIKGGVKYKSLLSHFLLLSQQQREKDAPNVSAARHFILPPFDTQSDIGRV